MWARAPRPGCNVTRAKSILPRPPSAIRSTGAPGLQLDIYLSRHADQGLGLWQDFTDLCRDDRLGAQGAQELRSIACGDGDEQAAGGLGIEHHGLDVLTDSLAPLHTALS